MIQFNVGDVVRTTNDIIGCEDDFYGHIRYAKGGDHLEILKVLSPSRYDVKVVKRYDNEHNFNQTFWVYGCELELVKGVNEDLSNLAYSVIVKPQYYRNLGRLDSWPEVVKILKAFKKKKNKGFYVEVNELTNNRGHSVKIFYDRK